MFGSRRFETLRRVAQQRADGVLRGRRGLAQQPPPLSARGAQRLLLVGIRSDLVRHPRDGGRRPRVGRAAGARAHLRGSARRQAGGRRVDGPCDKAASPGRCRCSVDPARCRAGVGPPTKIASIRFARGRRLTVTNGTTEEWRGVEIRLNTHYRHDVRRSPPASDLRRRSTRLRRRFRQRFDFGASRLTISGLTATARGAPADDEEFESAAGRRPKGLGGKR